MFGPRRGSFLRLLKSAVTVDDYVVVKVDIEGGPELNIVESIAHIPELSELVDELYFENHFRFWEMAKYWGGGNWGGDLAIFNRILVKVKSAKCGKQPPTFPTFTEKNDGFR